MTKREWAAKCVSPPVRTCAVITKPAVARSYTVANGWLSASTVHRVVAGNSHHGVEITPLGMAATLLPHKSAFSFQPVRRLLGPERDVRPIRL